MVVYFIQKYKRFKLISAKKMFWLDRLPNDWISSPGSGDMLRARDTLANRKS